MDRQSAGQHVAGSISKALLFAVFLPISYLLGKIVYNVIFHPLRGFPGPITHAASRIPYCVKLLDGSLEFDMLRLHDKYGPIVRIAPDELAFSTPLAWKDIMGHRGAGVDEMGKFDTFYRPVPSEPTHIVDAEREEHNRLRRQLAHGFSDKSMREQEPIITGYINLLIQRLHEHCNGGKEPLNLTAWYNYTTFDVIGDLAFGEPFDCLKNSAYHPWVKMIFANVRVGTILQTVSFFSIPKNWIFSLVPKKAKEKRESHLALTKAKLMRRMEAGKNRPDLIEGLLKKKDEWNMSLDKLQANSSILIIAGSETTATLLAGVTYFLLTNPKTLDRLTSEVRSSFKSEAEIDIMSVNKLEYMLACLDEALRMYPPVPTGLPRVVPKGGASIAGKYIPENTIVAIHQWATYHSAQNFTDPFNYHPERFLGDSSFAGDKPEALQPFHVGGRNCLGRNLAYTEMRLILARVLFNFDMKIADESRDWLARQRVFLMWDKGPLNVYLTPVKSEQ